MMFLATSPSPARKPAVRHNIPAAATRILFINSQSSQKSEDAARQSQSMAERERTFIMENEPAVDSSQASTATLVESSQSQSKMDTRSSIPFPGTSSSSLQSSDLMLRSPPQFSAKSRNTKSPLRTGASQEYHLGTPNISLNAHSITGSPVLHSPSRNQFSPSKVQRPTLGAGIDLTTS